MSPRPRVLIVGFNRKPPDFLHCVIDEGECA